MAHGAALLIGNASYRHMGGLRTPVDDVQNIGDRMHALGLETYEVKDADFATMSAVIGEFRNVIAALPGNSSVFIYFAGHGLQRQGENYLLPVDATLANEFALKSSSIALSALLEELCWREDQQKLIALDACRTNHLPSAVRSPFEGLAGISERRYESVWETKVLYATQPGWVASDGGAKQSSPFCRGLLEAFKEPDRPLSSLAAHVTHYVKVDTQRQQIPWDFGTISDFRPFLPSVSPVPTAAASVGEVASDGVVRVGDDIANKGHLIHKFKAKDTTGRWAYYCVLIEPPMERAFLEATESGRIIDLGDYGEVVASCYGEAPSDEMRAYLKDRYGFVV